MSIIIWIITILVLSYILNEFLPSWVQHHRNRRIAVSFVLSLISAYFLRSTLDVAGLIIGKYVSFTQVAIPMLSWLYMSAILYRSAVQMMAVKWALYVPFIIIAVLSLGAGAANLRYLLYTTLPLFLCALWLATTERH